MGKLFYNTAGLLLLNTLGQLMAEPLFNPFRLVGGTALSLQRGHRISVDIDLFTDVEYGSLDFDLFEKYLREKFSYFDTLLNTPVALGKTYYIGANEENSIKLDIYYTDPFIEKFTDFSRVDEDFEPECLRGKYWEIIKLDLLEFANR